MNEKKFKNIVSLFQEVKDEKNASLNMHYVLMKHKNNVFQHQFKKQSTPSDIRSISKTVMTIVLGVVMKQSEAGVYPPINENTYIYPIIEQAIQLTNDENVEKLKKVQIKHLLTHTIGYDDVLLMRDDIKEMDPYDYVNYVVNYPIVHEPGEHYLYSNAGFYLLGVVLQEFLQENLLTFIERELFSPLGIQAYEWEMYGDYIAAATRLWLRPEQLLSFGELLLNNGIVNGKQLIPENWVEKMTAIQHYTPSVDTPEATFRRYAYGYGIWLPKKSFYFGHGTDGQTLTILPEKETIFITLADQPDLKPIEKIINDVIENKL